MTLTCTESDGEPNLDEYVGLPPGHPSSFATYMWENLYGHVDANPASVHVLDGATEDPEAACDRYERTIQSEGGIDLCVLGVGRNGHIGFNEPGSPLDSQTRVVCLGDYTRMANAKHFVGDATPEITITVGIRTILESREVLLMASGRDKALIIAKALEGTIDKTVPASFLRLHQNLTVLIDCKAAGNVRSFPRTA
jgi:glucosamine-6-phosphate deaminase